MYPLNWEVKIISEKLNRFVNLMMFGLGEFGSGIGIYRIMNICKDGMEKCLAEGMQKTDILVRFILNTTDIERYLAETEKQCAD